MKKDPICQIRTSDILISFFLQSDALPIELRSVLGIIMLVFGHKNGNIKGVEIDKVLEGRKKIVSLNEDETNDILIKVINIKKGSLAIGLKNRGIKILDLYKNKNSIFLKNYTPNLRDFVFYLKSYVFVVFDREILTWKKSCSTRWKIFAKFNTKETIDKILIPGNSNLMITTSIYDNKLNIWSFSGEKISFCGRSFLKEKIISIGHSQKNKHFVVGSPSGKLYVYTSFGVLNSVISPSKNTRRKSFLTSYYPLDFLNDNVLFSGGNNRQLCKWDIRVGKIVSSWHGHVGDIRQISCSTNSIQETSYFIASSDHLGITKIWDIRKESEFFSFKPYPEEISSLLFG